METAYSDFENEIAYSTIEEDLTDIQSSKSNEILVNDQHKSNDLQTVSELSKETSQESMKQPPQQKQPQIDGYIDFYNRLEDNYNQTYAIQRPLTTDADKPSNKLTDDSSYIDFSHIEVSNKCDSSKSSSYEAFEEISSQDNNEKVSNESKSIDNEMKSNLIDEKWQIQWNSYFQRIIRMNENIEKYNQLRGLALRFVSTARMYGEIIISEVLIPDQFKTIKPISIGGVAGGDKYITQGILFKFVRDTLLGQSWMYGGENRSDECAMKSANHELKALVNIVQEINSQELDLISVPLMATIDFKGYRLIALCLLPINKQTIVYGSSDGGKTIHADNILVNETMKKICSAMNLKEHQVGKINLFAPGDIEVHESMEDNRFYILDFARLFPPEAPRILPNNCAKRSIFYNLLRPEFVRKYCKPLSSDAYSGWSMHDENVRTHNIEVKEATIELATKLIPEFAKLIDNQNEFNHQSLTTNLHGFGINLRHLGLIYNLVTKNQTKKLILGEMIARLLRKQLKNDWRQIKLDVTESIEEPYRQVVLDFFNLIFGNQQPQSRDLWYKQIKHKLQTKFSCQLQSDTDTDNDEIDLSRDIDIKSTIERLEYLCGVTLSDRVKTKLKEPNNCALGNGGVVKVLNSDLSSISSKVKHMNLIDWSEGLAFYETALIHMKNGEVENSRSLTLEAIIAFDRSLSMDPNNSFLLFKKTLCYQHLIRLGGDQVREYTKLVMDNYEKLLNSSYDRSQVLFSQSLLLFDLNKVKEAQQALDEALKSRENQKMIDRLYDEARLDLLFARAFNQNREKYLIGSYHKFSRLSIIKPNSIGVQNGHWETLYLLLCENNYGLLSKIAPEGDVSKLNEITANQMIKAAEISSRYLRDLFGRKQIQRTIIVLMKLVKQTPQLIEYIKEVIGDWKRLILSELRFSGNQFDDSDAEIFARLFENLIELDVRSSQLSRIGLEQIWKNCLKIEKLTIQTNSKIKNSVIIEMLSNLPKLNQLIWKDISNEDLNEVCESLSRLSLKQLTLECYSLEDDMLASMFKSGQLRLSLESCIMNGCSNFKKLAFESVMKNCIQLKEFSGGREIDLETFKLICKHQSMKILNLANCDWLNENLIIELANNQMKNENGLEEIDFRLCGRAMTSKALESLSRMKHLKRLNLVQCNQLQSSDICQLTITATQLTSLNVDGLKSIDDQSLIAIAQNCINLEMIDISGCANLRKSERLGEFSKNALKLKKINLTGCRLNSKQVCELISNLNQLQSIVLDDNAIEDQVVIIISRFKNIQSISLNYCQLITDRSIEYISRDCLSVCELFLRNCNRLTVVCLEKFQLMAKLNTISISGIECFQGFPLFFLRQFKPNLQFIQ